MFRFTGTAIGYDNRPSRGNSEFYVIASSPLGDMLRLGGGVFLADKTGGPKGNQSDVDERSRFGFVPHRPVDGEGSRRARQPGRAGKVSRNNSQQKCLTPTRKPLA
jgi:hypothetical protein